MTHYPASHRCDYCGTSWMTEALAWECGAEDAYAASGDPDPGDTYTGPTYREDD